MELLIEGAEGLGVVPQQVCEVARELIGRCDDPLPDDLAVITGKERKLVSSSITGECGAHRVRVCGSCGVVWCGVAQDS